MARSVTVRAEFEEILSTAGDKLVVIDFFATWCGPCKMIGPKFEKMAAEHTDVIFLKIDVDEADMEEVVESYDVKVMPTMALVKGGQTIKQLEGNVPDELKCEVEKNK